MTVTQYDSIVIGAGQAGPPLAVKLAQSGQRVALIEKRMLGGTCVNDGCIPTKTLIASARAAWVARHAADFGVRIGGEVQVDMRAVKQRKDAVVQESRQSLATWIAGTERLSLISGSARFESPHTLRVGEQLLQAERFFINTGARAFVPEVPGLDRVPYLTNIEMMELDTLPAHLVILGGSYIGLEFAQMYRRFGSEVTVIERADRLVPREDEDVSTALRELMKAEGIRVHLNAEAARVTHANGAGEGKTAIVIELANGEMLRGSHVLVAIGRMPNTEDLGLQAAGVALDDKGYVKVDEALQTSAPHIWALGEVNGRGAFTHTAYNDFEIVAANLLEGESRKVSDRISIYGLFTDPPLGRVGMSEREARASGKRVLIGKRPMTRVGRARERGETRGFIKLLADADSKQLLGAAIFGIEGDEAVHCIADLMYARAPYTTLQRAVHTHPTVSELLPTVAGELRPLIGSDGP